MSEQAIDWPQLIRKLLAKGYTLKFIKTLTLHQAKQLADT